MGGGSSTQRLRRPPPSRARSAAAELPLGAAGLRIAFAGGGTGGHVVPGVHLLRHMATTAPPAAVLWFGAGRRAENCALRGLSGVLEPGVRFEKVDLRLEPEGGGAPSPWALATRAAPAARLARRALARGRIGVVCGLGGFTSLPVVLAARSLGIPVALLEVNAVRGRATRWLAPLVDVVLHAWPGSLPAREPRVARHALVGPPLGPAFVAPPFGPEERAAEKRALGFAPERPLLVALGGSQGAAWLNRFARERAADLAGRGLSVLHQVGPGRAGEAAPAGERYRAVEFQGGMERVLRAADVVLTRGGASTLAEVAAAGAPAVVVPYPHHRDRHQLANARALGDGAVIAEESEGDDALLDRLDELVVRAGERERRSRALAERVPRDGAARLFRELALLSQGGVSHD